MTYKVLYVYILKCADGSYYIGVTNDADKRLLEHNLGINKDSYTYSRRPCEMVYSEMFADFDLAIEWETRIKKWSRAKKEALINGEFERLPELSKKKFKK
jgi:putative endonuclease